MHAEGATVDINTRGDVILESVLPALLPRPRTPRRFSRTLAVVPALTLALRLWCVLLALSAPRAPPGPG